DLDRRPEAEEALAELGRRLALEPQTEGTLAWHCVTSAQFAQEGGEIEQARTTFARCLDEHPDSVDVVQNAARFHDSIGERDRAIEILRAALGRAPASRPLRIALAERLGSEGDAVGAEAVLREAARPDDPGSAAAWADLAKFRQGLGDQAGAAQAF